MVVNERELMLFRNFNIATGMLLLLKQGDIWAEKKYFLWFWGGVVIQILIAIVTASVLSVV